MNDAYGVVDSLGQADASEAQYSGSDGTPLLRVGLLGGFRVERTNTAQAVSDWQPRSANPHEATGNLHRGKRCIASRSSTSSGGGVAIKSALNSLVRPCRSPTMRWSPSRRGGKARPFSGCHPSGHLRPAQVSRQGGKTLPSSLPGRTPFRPTRLAPSPPCHLIME